MGAYTFRDYVHDRNLKRAFRSAVDQARYEHGHGGYTGTIAEKNDVVVIDDSGMGLPEAKALARQLIEQGDPRIDSKRGPAGAIRVVGGGKHRFFRGGFSDDPQTGWQEEECDGWLFFGWARS